MVDIDASKGPHGSSVAVVVDFRGSPVDYATLRRQDTDAAETSAILMAVRGGEANNKSLNIIAHSTIAIKIVPAGIIPMGSKNIPKELNRIHNITWYPAHEVLEGNESADSLARSLTNRSDEDHSYEIPPYESYGDCLRMKS